MASIEIIANQPISLNPDVYPVCVEEVEHCTRFGKDDGIAYCQFKMNPCSEDLVDNGSFTSEYGAWIYDSGAWTWGGGSGNNFLQCNTTNVANGLVQTIPFGVTGNYIRTSITVFNMTQGALILDVDSVQYLITGNGTFTFYTVQSGATNEIQVVPDYANYGPCDAMITNINAYTYRTNDYHYSLLELDGTVFQGECLGHKLYNEFFTIGITLNCLPAGCYRLKVCEGCLHDTLGLIKDSNFEDYSYWTCPDVNTSWGLGSFDITTVGGTEVYTIDYVDPVLSLPYPCLLTVSGPNVLTAIHFPEEYLIEIGYNGSFFDVSVGEAIEVPAGGLVIQIRITLTGFSAGSIFSITNIQVNAAELPQNCHTSNCIQILDTNDLQGTTLVTGLCNQGSTEFNFGWFDYITNFPFCLIQRLSMTKFAPTYPIDGKDYIYSDGTRKITSAQRSKFYEFIFGGLSELQHDVLSLQVISTHFLINGVEYFVEPNDYKPEWSKTTAYGLADVRMLGMKQGTIIFRENQNL